MIKLVDPQEDSKKLEQLIETLQHAKEKRRAENKLKHYEAYPKQREFHAKGEKRERLFMAANQSGKTIAGGFEIAMHLTGIYPDWWTGRRYNEPVVGWVAGVTGDSTRDNPQRILLGRVGEHGSGAIPKACLTDIINSRGVPGAVDMIRVKHVSGGISQASFKSYERGREKWQGETLDFVWYDEEPPADIYSEGLTRTQVKGGFVIVTFTPLLGMSEVVRRYLNEPSDDRCVISMTIDDALHYTQEERDRIVAAYPEHEREARAKGIPFLGSGRIFPIAESSIICEPFHIPNYYAQIGAIDFGWDHPTACVKLAWDRDDDVVYVTACHRLSKATPIIHAETMRAWGEWLPWAWPHDGLQHSKDSGIQLAEQYRNLGLRLLWERAQFEDGSNGVEAGLLDMLTRMQTGRFKVFKHLADWFEEFRLYHRKEGRVVKEHDDLMSATRYAVMSLRYGIPQPREEEDDYEELRIHEIDHGGRSTIGGY